MSTTDYRPLLFIIAGLLIVQASFGVCVQDDAYISFRYARNLAEGAGLVFNPGEPVEGYTNFLWTVLFAPIIGVGLDPTTPSMMLGILSCAALLWSAWEAGGRRWLAPLLVATFPGLALEGVQGLETAFFAAALACVELQLDPPLSILRSVVPFVTTLRGEAFVAVLGVLFLFAMGTFGVVMAIILLCTLALNGYVAVTSPESMQRDGGGDAGPQFAAAGYDVDDAAFSPAAQPSTADL